MKRRGWSWIVAQDINVVKTTHALQFVPTGASMVFVYRLTRVSVIKVLEGKTAQNFVSLELGDLDAQERVHVRMEQRVIR